MFAAIQNLVKIICFVSLMLEYCLHSVKDDPLLICIILGKYINFVHSNANKAVQSDVMRCTLILNIFTEHNLLCVVLGNMINFVFKI